MLYEFKLDQNKLEAAKNTCCAQSEDAVDQSSIIKWLKMLWLGWVGFYGISTIVGYLMPDPVHTYILNIYDLVWLGFMAYQPL